MTLVKQKSDGSFEVVSGRAILSASLEMNGTAQVTVVESRAKLIVHEIDGKLVAITEDSQASIDDLTQAAINRAR